jgi:hypothetical protein
VRLRDGRELQARLTIAADGRSSVARQLLPLEDLGAPMDVFWFRIAKSPGESGGLRGNVEPGRLLVMIDRGDYWQCAFLIPKGAAEEYQARGIAAIREERLEKVILSREVVVPGPVDLLGSYVHGRRHNTPARSFVVDTPQWQAVGFSPEIVMVVGADGRRFAAGGANPSSESMAVECRVRRNGEWRLTKFREKTRREEGAFRLPCGPAGRPVRPIRSSWARSSFRPSYVGRSFLASFVFSEHADRCRGRPRDHARPSIAKLITSLTN